jgi:predicted protein tyrosine phosphatase
MKVLFVCNQGENRSKTAALIFKDRFETRAKGLYNNLLKEEDLEWANLIVVMEDHQRKTISERFPKSYLKKKIISLDIPDVYYYNQDSLIHVLNDKFTQAVL